MALLQEYHAMKDLLFDSNNVHANFIFLSYYNYGSVSSHA